MVFNLYIFRLWIVDLYINLNKCFPLLDKWKAILRHAHDRNATDFYAVANLHETKVIRWHFRINNAARTFANRPVFGCHPINGTRYSGIERHSRFPLHRRRRLRPKVWIDRERRSLLPRLTNPESFARRPSSSRSSAETFGQSSSAAARYYCPIAKVAFYGRNLAFVSGHARCTDWEISIFRTGPCLRSERFVSNFGVRRTVVVVWWYFSALEEKADPVHSRRPRRLNLSQRDIARRARPGVVRWKLIGTYLRVFYGFAAAGKGEWDTAVI